MVSFELKVNDSPMDSIVQAFNQTDITIDEIDDTKEQEIDQMMN